MPKVILIDAAVLAHRSIFNYGSLILKKMNGLIPPSTFIAPAPYSYFAQIISILKKIGVEPDDKVIFCLEGHSWRKNYDANYKANRQEYRDTFTHIDWPKEYNGINRINEQLEASTNFYFIRLPNAESDDIIATAVKFFKNQPCIIVSIDADLDQLAYYENVKIFSPLVKYKSIKGAYKQVDNPLAIIEKKCRLGDKSDNILVGENDKPEDYELRKFIIDLINLPEFVSLPIIEELKKVEENHVPAFTTWRQLPYPDTLGLKLPLIYEKEKVITFDECIEYSKKRTARKVKKAKAKRDEKIHSKK